MFDARRWVEANKPPVFVDLDGATFTGRLWSHLEKTEWKRVFQEWLTGKQDDSKYEPELRRMIASMGFTDDAIDRMLKLPDGAFEGLLESFFVCQGLGPKVPSTPASPPPSSGGQMSPTTTPASPPSAS